jgi:hypothetical protein
MVKVNFAELPEYTPLGRGTYHFAITDGIVDEHGDEAQYPGNDFWKLELTVQDGPMEGKTQSLTVTLPPYEPFTLANILRATVGQHEWTEEELKEGEYDVEMDHLVREDNPLEFIANVAPQKGNSDYNNVSRIRPYDPEEWEVEDPLP